MKILATLAIILLSAVSVFGQATPRYAPSKGKITDAKQVASMLKEFQGEYTIAGISQTAPGLGFHGKLNVTDTKVDILLDKQYLGREKGIVTLADPEDFVLQFLFVGQDTIDNGALFMADFVLQEEAGPVELQVRVFPNGRMVGAARTTTKGYIVLGAPVKEENFLSSLQTAALVYLTAMAEEDPVAKFMTWGVGTFNPIMPPPNGVPPASQN